MAASDTADQDKEIPNNDSNISISKKGEDVPTNHRN